MKLSEAIMEALNDTDEAFLEKSEYKRKTFTWKHVTALLSAAAAVVLLAIVFPGLGKNAASPDAVSYDSKDAETMGTEGAVSEEDTDEIAAEVYTLEEMEDASTLILRGTVVNTEASFADIQVAEVMKNSDGTEIKELRLTDESGELIAGEEYLLFLEKTEGEYRILQMPYSAILLNEENLRDIYDSQESVLIEAVDKYGRKK